MICVYSSAIHSFLLWVVLSATRGSKYRGHFRVYFELGHLIIDRDRHTDEGICLFFELRQASFAFLKKTDRLWVGFGVWPCCLVNRSDFIVCFTEYPKRTFCSFTFENNNKKHFLRRLFTDFVLPLFKRSRLL